MEDSIASRLAASLARTNLKIVLAESCTGGLASALLTEVPGISNNFCGSVVTYRATSKSAWLGIDSAMIEAHTAESPEITIAMAIGVLDRTMEADWSAAITGHLGPGAPPEKDGLIFIATAQRIDDRRVTHWAQLQLQSTLRAHRQREAAVEMLLFLLKCIEQSND